MLEQIAAEVGLRKRVVQVWFQNTRARERKGQFRAHQQVINKRCPFCPALFKVRSALESHLATKHSDQVWNNTILFKIRSYNTTAFSFQYTRGEINIDALPDAEGIEVGGGSGGSPVGEESGPSAAAAAARSAGLMAAAAAAAAAAGPLPPAFPGGAGPSELGESMRRYYEDPMKRYMNDIQQQQQQQQQNAEGPQQNKKEGSFALDLTSVPPPPLPLPAAPALDLSGLGSNDRERSEDRSDSLSTTENNVDTRAFDSEEGENDGQSPRQANNAVEAANSPSSPGGGCNSNSANKAGEAAEKAAAAAKRFRTQMSNMQIKMMKSVFQHYKTPTMNECAILGSEIGLQKRVVQVWFQNARAKEKKAKLHLQQLTGQEPENPPPPEECHFCNYVYTHKFVIQDHLFSKGHLDKIRFAIDEGGYDPESPGHALTQAAALIQGPTPGAPGAEGLPPGAAAPTPGQQQLQMLQMAVAQGIRLPPPPPTSSSTENNVTPPSSTDNPPPPLVNEDAAKEEPSQGEEDDKRTEDGEDGKSRKSEVEKTLMQQLYGSHGLSAPAAFPSGVAAPNPFLHPAIFSSASASSGESDGANVPFVCGLWWGVDWQWWEVYEVLGRGV